MPFPFLFFSSVPFLFSSGVYLVSVKEVREGIVARSVNSCSQRRGVIVSGGEGVDVSRRVWLYHYPQNKQEPKKDVTKMRKGIELRSRLRELDRISNRECSSKL